MWTSNFSRSFFKNIQLNLYQCALLVSLLFTLIQYQLTKYLSSNSSSQFRRHKSASPSRRKSVPPPNQCGCHHHHHDGSATLRRHNHTHSSHMSATLRSKSTGQLLDADQLLHHHHHTIRGSSRSRSRSKSKLPDCNECCSTEHLDSIQLSRGDRSTQSTRSTRWEVYRHVDAPNKKSLNSSQRRKSPIYKVLISLLYTSVQGVQRICGRLCLML